MTDPLETHTISVDQAVAVYEQAVQALHLPDGKKKYSDEEHNRRQTEALAKVQSVVERAQEVAGEAREQAERDAEAASSDPSAWLTPSELATANSRALFIAEDAKRLPLPELARRGEQVLDSKDKVSIFLHARYLGQRIEAVLEADEQAMRAGGIFGGYTRSTQGEGLSELMRVVEKLNDAATPAEVKQRAKQAQARREQAWALEGYAGTQLAEVDGSYERARKEFEQMVRSHF